MQPEIMNDDQRINLINQFGSLQFWMGLTDLKTSGTFLWNSTGLGPSYIYWVSSLQNYRCAGFLGASNGQWNLFDCNQALDVVCQTGGNKHKHK
jgi:hypothetical protein